MKQAILVLSLSSVGLAVMGQDNSTANTMNDGRTAARDMKAEASPAALPVMNTYVPPEVMSKATSSYGKNLYSVTQVKSAAGDSAYAYAVTLVNSGQPSSMIPMAVRWLTYSARLNRTA